MASLLALTVTAIGVALWLRFGLIENAPLGRACDAAGGLAACPVRQITILMFNHSVFGWAALLASATALWRPSVLMTSIALIAAAMGLVLYNTATAAFACGLIVLVLARPANARTMPPKA
jgi:hypothetical protein